MKRAFIGLAVFLIVVAAALSLTPVRARLIAMTLPDQPNWPTPQQTLQVGDQGVIYYPTTSPYDLAVILGDMSLAPATTGKGYLSIPDTARSQHPTAALSEDTPLIRLTRNPHTTALVPQMHSPHSDP